MSSFWNLNLRTGRKDHRCEACWRTVHKGEQSYTVAGVSDGDFHSYRECIPCKQLIDRLYDSGALDYGEGFMLCDLPEIARDNEEPWPPVLDTALERNPNG